MQGWITSYDRHVKRCSIGPARPIEFNVEIERRCRIPYIKQQIRDRLAYEYFQNPESVGELNYCITRLLHKYIDRRGGLSYATVNEAIGAVECAKLELYRAIAVPYENSKRILNGPISDLDAGQSPSMPCGLTGANITNGGF